MGNFAGGITENARISGLLTFPNTLATSDDLNDDENVNEEDPEVQATIQKSLNVIESTDNTEIGPNGLLQGFRSILYNDSVEGFEKAWEALKEKFGTQTGLFTVLNYNFQSLIFLSYPFLSRNDLHAFAYGMGQSVHHEISQLGSNVNKSCGRRALATQKVSH